MDRPIVEYFFVKLFLVLAFFTTLISLAFWANDKLNDYFGDEDNRH